MQRSDPGWRARPLAAGWAGNHSGRGRGRAARAPAGTARCVWRVADAHHRKRPFPRRLAAPGILVNERHWLTTDEPASLGGEDTAPTPYELLPAAVAACVVTTIRMYARRKGWDVGEILVDASLDHAARPQSCTIHLRLPEGLSDEQRDRLERVAQACAVHRTLENGLDFEQTVELAAAA